MEAGAAPVRGQRAFNTSLAPVDFSFSTYLRPKNVTTAINAEESVLWNALFSTVSTDTAAVSIGSVTGATYAFSNGVGTLTLTGTALTGTGGVAAGDVVVVSGISVSSGATDTFFNAAAVVTGTPSATAVTMTLVNPTTTASTLTAATTVKLYKSAWAPVKNTYSYASTAASDKHQLLKFGMLFMVDNVAYAVDNAAMGQVTIDFGIDAIATAQWSGQATALRQVSTNLTAVNGTFGGTGITGNYLAKVTDAQYIANKLSTVSLTLVNSLKDSSGTTQGAAGDSYTVPITGGSITINNNVTYLTPANLGVVNLPVAYYTGARSITGTLNAYLRTGGTRDTGELLADMLAAASATIEPMASLQISIGGASTVKVGLDMPASVLSIPTVDVQQVVSTAINFTAEGYVPSSTAEGNLYDLSKTNDFAV
ncbi:MAG: hypothetical protein ACKOXV_02235, partial [Bacteroidota bacterium]